MLLQPANHNGYQVLRILQNTFSDDDIEALKRQIKEYLDKGITRIALAFIESIYPYSKLVSLITQCYRMINEKRGSLVVVQPSQAFARVADSLNLPTVVRIVASEDDL